MKEKKFVINKFLALNLEKDGSTKIYVNGEEFLLCKAILLNFPKEMINEVRTMDEVFATSTFINKKDELIKYEITPEVKFWVHCSNLQTWAENEYNTDLLEVNLAFPLLRRLAEVGDVMAKKKFKIEIIKRYVHGSYDTKRALEGFLELLSQEEIIIGGLGFKESTLLKDIITSTEKFGIRYEMVNSFDEDHVRRRTHLNDRFFTIYGGHVKSLEFDLFKGTYELFEKFKTLKRLRSLKLLIRNLNGINSYLTNLKIESVKGLDIYNNLTRVTNFRIDIPSKLYDCFPNVEILEIHSKYDISESEIESMCSLKKLEIIAFHNCSFNNEKLAKKIEILKKKGILVEIV